MFYKHVPILFGLLCVLTGIMGSWFMAFNCKMIIIWDLIVINSYSISFPILLDSTSLIFTSLVAFITANVLIFGFEYIRGEDRLIRFWLLLVGFVVSIFLVIFTPNFFTIIIGWDGLGITRFLLIIHYQDQISLWGGILTVFLNRLGDVILILVVSIYIREGTRHIFILKGTNPGFISLYDQALHPEYLVVTLLCMVGYSKRAQIPFNLWLPEAIAAPTPISTLVHSSTLVTAGVYLLIRSFNIWSQWPIAIISICATGFGTIIAGGGLATTEIDLKKTIAYSTIRQVGIITIILGLGFPTLAFIHLVTHALFKATIFMRAGSVFIYAHHYQTFDNYHTKWYMPLTGLGLIVSILAINVFPFFASMYTKELIILRRMENLFIGSNIILVILTCRVLLIGSGLTTIYSVRLWRGLWSTKYFARTYIPLEKVALRPDQYAIGNPNLKVPLTCMITGSVTGGSLITWFIISPVDIPLIHPAVKLITSLAVIFGLFGAFYPCRGTTKARHNALVIRSTYKKGDSPSSSKGCKTRNTGGDVLCSLWASIGSEWSHINNRLPFFIDRVIHPAHRIIYTRSKAFLFLDAGLLELWTVLISSEYINRAAKLLQSWHPLSVMIILGPPVLVGTSIEIALNLLLVFD